MEYPTKESSSALTATLSTPSKIWLRSFVWLSCVDRLLVASRGVVGGVLTLFGCEDRKCCSSSKELLPMYVKLQNLQRKYFVFPWQSEVFRPIPISVPPSVTCWQAENRKTDKKRFCFIKIKNQNQKVVHMIYTCSLTGACLVLPKVKLTSNSWIHLNPFPSWHNTFC